ncbi:MAG: hypothetical protein J7K40_04930 [candidate division Zixibacteria bacterium]|nr:hypothetical protein [candidate division Zixibacteria bacterium]
MNRLAVVLFSTLLLLLSVIDTLAVELSGYYEPQYLGIRINDSNSQLFSSKLRVDLQSSDIDNVKFAANFDYITYHGHTQWNMLDYLPKTITSIVPSDAIRSFDFIYNDTIFLDNAYLKFAVSKFDITLGKQQISPGTGYAWNPTDLFNSKNIIDPTYEQSGHNAVRIDFAASSRYSVMFIGLPEQAWNNSGKMISFKGKLSHFDYSMTYIEKQWLLSDFITYQMSEQKRRLYGGDLVGELFGLGIWGEYGYNTMKSHSDFWEALIGIDYTLDNGAYLMAEYYYNELGQDDYHQYDINDWMRYFLTESRTISKDNLYLYFSYPLTDLIQLDNSVIISLSDKSFGIVPAFQYSIYENVDLNALINYNIGDDEKAYSNGQGISGTVRFRIYF